MLGSRSSINTISIVSSLGDAVWMNLVFVVYYSFRSSFSQISDTHILFFLYLNGSWFLLSFLFGAFNHEKMRRISSFLSTYSKILVFFFFLFLMFFQLRSFSYYPREWIKYIFPLFFFLLFLWKQGIFFLEKRIKGSYPKKRFLVVGSAQIHHKLLRLLEKEQGRLHQSVGFVDIEDSEAPAFLGNTDTLPALLLQLQVEEIYVAMHLLADQQSELWIRSLNASAAKIKLVPDMGQFLHHSVELSKLGKQYVLTLHEGPLSYWYNKAVKRLLDITVSLLVLVCIMSWLLPLLSLVYGLIEGRGPLFKQKRSSLYGRIFTILKFRTMKENAAADELQATADDERITKIGRILRQSQLDELPQFWNVLKGEMSIIGPRPHMLLHTKEYSKVAEQFMLRHAVKPGISGWAQINGYRGEVRSDQDIANRVAFDIEYIHHWSISFEIYIMWKTLLLMLGIQKSKQL